MIILVLLAFVRAMLAAPQRYHNTCPNLFMLSSSSNLTQVLRKATAVCTSSLALLQRKRNFAMLWWKNLLLVPISFFPLLLTLNRCVLAGMAHSPDIVAGSSLSMMPMQSFMLNL